MSLIDKYAQWTLFLDRDGVINQHPKTHYVFDRKGFLFCPGAIEAIAYCSQLFKHIIVVTNQQGIGKGLMTEHDLDNIHDHLNNAVVHFGGHIDAIYHCPDLSTKTGNCRKPSPAMAHKAQSEFPDIEFSRSIMVGDQITDLEFAENAGMKKVLVKNKAHNFMVPTHLQPVIEVQSLMEFRQLLQDQKLMI